MRKSRYRFSSLLVLLICTAALACEEPSTKSVPKLSATSIPEFTIREVDCPKVPPLPPLKTASGKFPLAGVDHFLSSGDADVWSAPLQPEFQLHFFGVDAQTEVWRSDPVVLGSPEDLGGVRVGRQASNIQVSHADIKARPQLPDDSSAGLGRRRKFFAELHNLDLKGQGAEVLAGEAFLNYLVHDLHLSEDEVKKVFRRSYGEVVSRDVTGNPEKDFPADNYFNVFFAVHIYGTSGSPEMALFNKDPLVVVDQGITEIPPLNRLTIPRFPSTVDLYYVKDPLARAGIGDRPAGWGMCGPHAVNLKFNCPAVSLDFSSILAMSTSLAQGAGIHPLSGDIVPPGVFAGSSPVNASKFAALPRNPFIDGVFVVKGSTQINTTGLTIDFGQTSGDTTDAIRNGVAAVEASDTIDRIWVKAPSPPLPYQPPQSSGIGMPTNSGITFDLEAIRRANPSFYLVDFVALEGMSSRSNSGSAIRLRVFVDGIPLYYADHTFSEPGSSLPITIDLQRAKKFLTLVATTDASARSGGRGVFALAKFRGFAQ